MYYTHGAFKQTTICARSLQMTKSSRQFHQRSTLGMFEEFTYVLKTNKSLRSWTSKYVIIFIPVKIKCLTLFFTAHLFDTVQVAYTIFERNELTKINDDIDNNHDNNKRFSLSLVPSASVPSILHCHIRATLMF